METKTHPQTGSTTVKQAEKLLWDAANKLSRENHQLEQLIISSDMTTTEMLQAIVNQGKQIKKAADEVIDAA